MDLQTWTHEFTLPQKFGTARGFKKGSGITVLKGSLIAPDEAENMEFTQPTYWRLRRDLKTNGVIVKNSSGQWRFAKDHQFSSLSGAACVIEGGSRSGPKAWKPCNKQ